MAAQLSLESTFEFPTKFNKYRRLHERADPQNVPYNNRAPKLEERLSKTPEWTSYPEDEPLNLTVQRNAVDSSSKTAQISSSHNISSSLLKLNVNRNSYEDESSSFVDEHFQRSLGRNYIIKQTQISPLRTGESSQTTVQYGFKHGTHSIHGSVDDHFSKSLGEVWTKVKSSVITADTNNSDRVQQASVDEHFVKALGETWIKIQTNSDSEPGCVESTKEYCRHYNNSPQRISQISYSR